MQIIHVPRQIGDGFGEGIAAFLSIQDKVRLLQPNDALTFDMSQCRFLNPFLILPLMVLINEQKKKRQVIVSLSGCSPQFRSYLNTIYFGEGLKPANIPDRDYKNFLSRFQGRTYIPIICFPADRLYNHEEIRSQFISAVNQLLIQQTGLKGGYLNAVMHVVTEAVNNVVDHSGEINGYLFAQYYPRKKYIDICFVDNGVGIRQTYANHGRTDILSHSQAVRHAAIGVSTKNRPEAENRGFGITTSKKMIVVGLSGRYMLISGNAFLTKYPDNEAVIETDEHNVWNGTIVAMRIPYSLNVSFKAEDYYEN
jgi:anti-sigma regulatory factor (Ser/Thr protein kinase)